MILEWIVNGIFLHGGMVKRIAAKASLQRHKENQIPTARGMFNFARRRLLESNFSS